MHQQQCLHAAYSFSCDGTLMPPMKKTAALTAAERQRRRRAKLRQETLQREAERLRAFAANSATRIPEAQLAAQDTTDQNARTFAEVTRQQDAVRQANLQHGRRPASRAPFAAADCLTNAMSLGECITLAKAACPASSKVVGQVEVGTQCSLPLTDKSVGCSFKAGSQSRSVQTVETVDQSSSTSASRPSISPSTAKGDNSQQGCLHRCRLCDFEADKLFRPGEHTKVHTGKCLFNCHLCPMSFSKRNTLNRHLFSHTGKHLFKCPSCPRDFSRKVDLNRHLCTHTGEKPFRCPSCHRSFTRKSTLKEHLHTHTGEKPFQCPSCPWSFAHKSGMKSHLRIHSGEKPFQCSSCPRSFARKPSMKQHLRIHTGDRPYHCTVCTESFARADYLRRHKRTQHRGTAK
ncbi:zinc finger protein 425 [Dermacentor silvarum]|uniref:zinc finger protein 425 n=1 Tax=Dermacentor silvarum TaxID=543639 RepID=UPI0021007B87|nr:zinc finger protein 425 [Dermacentor silvarum]